MQLSDSISQTSSQNFDHNVVIEGFLKRQKTFMSSKDFYRVIGKVMLSAPNPKKTFKEKYDLSNYQVQLS